MFTNADVARLSPNRLLRERTERVTVMSGGAIGSPRIERMTLNELRNRLEANRQREGADR